MSKFIITSEDINKLGLEPNTWYSLVWDGTTIRIFQEGKFIKSMPLDPTQEG